MANIAGGAELSGVGADELDGVLKGARQAEEGVEAHGGDLVGEGVEAACLDDGVDGVGAHELGAVEQRQAFLAHQCHGLQSVLCEHFGRGTALALVPHFAQAEQRQRHVGQRGQVAGSAERALAVDDGGDAQVEEVEQALNGRNLHAALAKAQGVSLEQQHEANYLRANGFAHAARVALHQILLEAAQVAGADAHVAERAKAGGDAVDGALGRLDFAVKILAALLDERHGFGAELQVCAGAHDMRNLVDGEVLWGDGICHWVNVLVRRR